MTFALLLDEDSMSRGLLSALRSRGIDVVTVSEAGRRRMSDEDQLEFALTAGRSVFSANRRDFARLHHRYMLTGRHHAGIVLLRRQRRALGDQLRGIVRLLGALTADEMRDRLEYI